MLKIQAKENKCIDLGRRGEDSARVILFDISGWAELYGQGEARLIAKRDHDLDSYPVEITQDNTTVSWVVKPVDNDQPGYGNCELVYITDNHVVKSVIYQTHTDVSLSDPISPPNSPTTYESLKTDIGNLSDLSTEAKDCLVSAINEIHDQVESCEVPVLNELPTPSAELENRTVILSNGSTYTLYLCVFYEGKYQWVPISSNQPTSKSSKNSSVLGVAVLGKMTLGSQGGSEDTPVEKSVGIESIEQTATSTEDGGVNEITATLTDGSTSVFYVRNGSKGSKGDKGDTPQKGVDYYTETDKKELVTAVLNALPDGDEVSY